MPDGSDARPRAEQARILVVDDEADIREAIHDLLTMSLEGTEVHTAASAQEARRILNRVPIDLILTDYRMPGQNGLEFLESLDPSGRAARVLLTAYPEVEVAERAVGPARVEAFLAKPIEPEELLDILGRILRGEWSREKKKEHHDAILTTLRSRAGV